MFNSLLCCWFHDLYTCAYRRSPTRIEAHRLVKIKWRILVFLLQGKFSKKPFVFVTVAHHHAGLKRDAASVWLEDIAASSCKICLRELQNYAGSHEDIYVVSKEFDLGEIYLQRAVQADK